MKSAFQNQQIGSQNEEDSDTKMITDCETTSNAPTLIQVKKIQLVKPFLNLIETININRLLICFLVLSMLTLLILLCRVNRRK